MLYVSQITLDVNGQQIDDFKSVSENEREIRKQINLATTTGYIKTTVRFGCKVEYVIPESAAEFDWDSLESGRLTIEYENGKRTTYTGVYTLKVGETKYDGENEATQQIELGAENRIIE